MCSKKLSRANELFQSLKEEVGVFLRSEPYHINTKRRDDGRLVYYLDVVSDVPEEISFRTGEVLQSLRSALDHKACELFRINNNGSERHIHFPIYLDETSYEKNKESKTRGIPKFALDYIDSISPYKEGNLVLWQLNELNNIDKHRALVTSGATFHSLDIGSYMRHHMMKALSDTSGDFPEMPFFVKPADNLFPLTAGKELFIDGVDAEETPGMKFAFQIVLNEPGVVEGEDLIQFIERVLNEVEKHISTLETLTNQNPKSS